MLSVEQFVLSTFLESYDSKSDYQMTYIKHWASLYSPFPNNF